MSKYDFGNKLYALRTEKNLTQKDLAKILGVSDKAVSKWETGEAMPRLKTLQAIADCFSVSYEALLSQSSEEAETTETVDTEAKEAAESNYEKFYNNRLKKDKNELKFGIIFLAIFILINFCTIFFGNFSATFSGVMMPNIFQNIIFNLLPVFVSIGFWFFTNKTFSQIDNLDIEEYATRYFPTMSVPLIIYSILIAVKNIIRDDIGSATIFAGTAVFILFATVIASIKKEYSSKYINIAITVSLILLVLIFPTVIYFFADTNIIGLFSLCFILLSQIILGRTNDLVLLIHTLKKVDKPTNPQKIKLKKIVIRAFIVITVIFIIIAIILTLFPGIVLKYTLTKTTSNPNITFFENYDLAFEEDEATRIQISDITIEIPNKFVVEDRSIDKDVNTYNYFFDDQLIAWIRKYPKGKTLLDTETEGFENMMIKTFGAYPRNEFEYKKLIYTLDAEDINIFNYTQAITYTSLINIRNMFTMDGYYDITLYTNNEVSAEIMSSNLSDIGIYSATLYIPLDEYDYYIHFNSKREPIETFYKMLNSIELA